MFQCIFMYFSLVDPCVFFRVDYCCKRKLISQFFYLERKRITINLVFILIGGVYLFIFKNKNKKDQSLKILHIHEQNQGDQRYIPEDLLSELVKKEAPHACLYIPRELLSELVKKPLILALRFAMW